jgi:hypothetical protein
MSKAATTDELSALHREVATSLVEDLKGIETIEDPALRAKLRVEARAQAITFLKNNNITAAKGNTELDALAQALANKAKGRTSGLTPQALDEAAALHAQMHGTVQ